MELKALKPLLPAVGESDSRTGLHCICLRGDHALATNGKVCAQVQLYARDAFGRGHFKEEILLRSKTVRMMLEIEEALAGGRSKPAEFVEPGTVDHEADKTRFNCGPVALSEEEIAAPFPNFDPILNRPGSVKRVAVAFSVVHLRELLEVAEAYLDSDVELPGMHRGGVVLEIPIKGGDRGNYDPVGWRIASEESFDEEPVCSGAIMPMFPLRILNGEGNQAAAGEGTALTGVTPLTDGAGDGDGAGAQPDSVGSPAAINLAAAVDGMFLPEGVEPNGGADRGL